MEELTTTNISDMELMRKMNLFMRRARADRPPMPPFHHQGMEHHPMPPYGPQGMEHHPMPPYGPQGMEHHPMPPCGPQGLENHPMPPYGPQGMEHHPMPPCGPQGMEHHPMPPYGPQGMEHHPMPPYGPQGMEHHPMPPYGPQGMEHHQMPPCGPQGMNRPPHSRERMLLLIGENNEGIRQKALSEKLGINQSSTSELVDKLETSGYIARKVDPNDRRATLIFLTELGQARMAEIQQEQENMFGGMFRKLSEDEKKQLSDLLDKLLSE